MNEEIEARNRRASASVSAHTEMVAQARLLVEATVAFQNALSAIHATMKHTQIEFNLQTDTPKAESIGKEATEHCHETLDTTIVAMKQAEDVHALARDKLQIALIERDIAVKSATAITACISLLSEANKQEKRELGRRNLCGLPPELWAQIFAEVILPDRDSPRCSTPMPRGWSHGSRAMLLASVCGEWRDVAISTKALWTTINIAPARQSNHTLSDFVNLHLARMGPLACNVIVNVDTPIVTKDAYSELKPIFARIKKLHQLRFYIDYSARHLIGLLYNMLPTPEDLVLETTNVEGARYIYLPLGKPAPKNVTLISCELLGSCAAPLTQVVIERSDGDYHDFGDWRHGSLSTLERAAFRYHNSRVEPGAVRLEAPCLQYVETPLSLLSNRVLPLYDMPNLRELFITDVEGYRSQTWEAMAGQLGKETNLEKLVVQGPGTRMLIESLETLPSLATLEIRGEHVGEGLAKLKEKLESKKFSMRNFRTLVVADYMGDGQAILELAKVIEAQGRIQLEVINCPNLSRKTKEVLSGRRAQ